MSEAQIKGIDGDLGDNDVFSCIRKKVMISYQVIYLLRICGAFAPYSAPCSP
jgi:hypothetical protein